MPKPNRNSHWCVRNINGTTKNKCECKSWLAHWRNYTDSKRIYCAAVPCSNQAEVGAHVQIDDWRSDFSWWIVPLCKKHNHHTNTREMFIDWRSILVSADSQATCRRGDWNWKVKD
jgi:hypothetical protein